MRDKRESDVAIVISRRKRLKIEKNTFFTTSYVYFWKEKGQTMRLFQIGERFSPVLKIVIKKLDV
jgi:hypothetical protein